MGALTALGLNTAEGAIMCVSAPDSVLAEAGLMKPRPSFASTLLTAEPTARMVWWPEKRHMDRQTLGRLKWMLEVGGGLAWLVVDADEEESPSEDELATALAAVGLSPGSGVELGRGETAIAITVG